MEKVLQLVFKKADGSKKVFSVTDPRDDVTADEAKTAMETVIAADIFAADGIGLTEAVEARVAHYGSQCFSIRWIWKRCCHRSLIMVFQWSCRGICWCAWKADWTD